MTGTLSIARTLLRRRIRRAITRPKRTALTVALFLFPLVPFVIPGTVGGVGVGLGDGTVVVDGELIAVAPLFEAGFSMFWLFSFVAAAFNVEDDVAELDAGGLLVRAGGVSATIRGRELAGHARRLALFGIWFVVGVGALVLGGGSPAALPVGAVGFLLLLLSASTAGRAVGLLGRRAVLDRGYSVGRAKVGAAVLLFAATIAASSRGDLLVTVARGLPSAWFTEWLLFELSDTVRPHRLFGSLIFGVGLTVIGSRAHERLAADVWFRDPGVSDEAENGAGSGVIRVIAHRIVDGPAGALAWSVTLRRLRNPTYVGGVALFGMLFWHDVMAGFAPTNRQIAVMAYLAAALPAAVALNPLADEGAVLPMLLRSGLSGRGFVMGYALAAAGLAGIVAVAATAVIVGISGTVGIPAVIAVAGTPMLTFEAGCIAVAVGTVLPNADAQQIVDSKWVTFPSTYAIGAYGLAVIVVLAPLLAAVLLVGTTTALLVGSTGSLLLGGLGAVLAVRLAAPRFARYVIA